jgi:hypothetical protein
MMWKHTFLTVSLLFSAGAAAAAEEAVCPDHPKDQWVAADVVAEKLSRLIDKEFVLGIDKGCYEAEVLVNDDTEIDVYVDPVTTEVVKIRTEGHSDS